MQKPAFTFMQKINSSTIFPSIKKGSLHWEGFTIPFLLTIFQAERQTKIPSSSFPPSLLPSPFLLSGTMFWALFWFLLGLLSAVESQSLNCFVSSTEGSPITLSCPTGFQIYTTWASYGTSPSAPCGSHVYSSCHAGTSMLVFQTLWYVYMTIPIPTVFFIFLGYPLRSSLMCCCSSCKSIFLLTTLNSFLLLTFLLIFLFMIQLSMRSCL